jgi:dipeptidase
MKKNNTIDLEIERAAAGLTMDDFFFAVKQIRLNGISMYDEEHDRNVMISVDLKELHRFDPEIYGEDDSLEAVLYGVFEAMHDPEHRDCETRSWFNENFRDLNSRKGIKSMDLRTKAYCAMLMTLEDWLRIDIEDMFSDPRFLPSEEEVLERIRQMEASEKVS